MASTIDASRFGLAQETIKSELADLKIVKAQIGGEIRKAILELLPSLPDDFFEDVEVIVDPTKSRDKTRLWGKIISGLVGVGPQNWVFILLEYRGKRDIYVFGYSGHIDYGRTPIAAKWQRVDNKEWEHVILPAQNMHYVEYGKSILSGLASEVKLYNNKS